MEDASVLAGGITNAGRIVRVGDTVRRPARPTGAATRALLDHLERAGFDGAPRHRGHDPQGREVLSFVAGDVAIEEPPPAWALEEAALVDVARLLRRAHEAAAGFDPAGHAWPRAVPASFAGRIVCHNDPNLDNVVFREGRAVALIDWDLAAPAAPVWDVACAARLWVPLRDPRDLPPGVAPAAVLPRLRAFADAYGLAPADRERFAHAAALAHEWTYDVVHDAVLEGHPGFGALWREEGGRERAVRTARWLAAHGAALGTALA